jgi:hypothetical protein
MYRKKRVLIVLAIISICLVAFLYVKTWQHLSFYLHSSSALLIDDSDLEKEVPKQQIIHLYDGDYECVTQEQSEGDIVAPCPIDAKTEQYLEEVLQPLVFNQSEKGRLWSNLFSEKTPFDLKEKLLLLRRLLGIIAKVNHKNSHLIFGLSGGGELSAMARIAICDLLAQIHYHVSGGIHESIDSIPNDTEPKERITEEQRYALKRLYSMCRMTSSLSHKFSSLGFARASFEPTAMELKEAFRLFKIDREKYKDIVCYYRKKQK